MSTDIEEKVVKLTLDQSGLEKNATKAERHLQALETAAQNLKKNGFDGLSTSTLAVSVAFGNLLSLGVEKWFNQINSSIGGATARLDKLNLFPKVMDNMGYSAEKSTTIIKYLSEAIDGLPQTLDNVANQTQGLTAILGDAEQAARLTMGLNTAATAFGSSMYDASRFALQFNQILSRGQAGLQETRIFYETAPALMMKYAKSLSMTKDELEAYLTTEAGVQNFTNYISDNADAFHELALNANASYETMTSVFSTRLSKGVADFIDGITEAVGGIEKLQETALVLSNVFKDGLGGKDITKSMNQFVELFDLTIAGSGEEVGTQFANSFMGTATAVVSVAPVIAQAITQGVIGAAKNMPRLMFILVNKMLDQLAGAFISFGNNIENLLSGDLNGNIMSAQFRVLGAKIIKVLQSVLYAGFKTIGALIVSGLGKGITAGISTVINFFANFIESVKHLFGINSPSKVFFEIASQIIAGLRNGIAAGIGGVLDLFGKMLYNMIVSIDTFVGYIGATFINTTAGIGSTIVSTLTSIIPNITNTIATMFSSVTNAIKTFVTKNNLDVFLDTLVTNLKYTFSNLLGILRLLIGGLGTFLSSFSGQITQFLSGFDFAKLGRSIGELISNIVDGLSKIIEILGTIDFAGIVEAVVDGIKVLTTYLPSVEVFGRAIGGVFEAVLVTLDAISTVVIYIGKAVISAFSSIDTTVGSLVAMFQSVDGKQLFYIAAGLLAIVGAIMLLNAMSKMAERWKPLSMVTFIYDNKILNDQAAIILGFAAVIGAMAVLAAVLNNMDPDRLAATLALLVGTVTAMGAFMIAVGLLPVEKLAGAGAIITGFGLVLIGMGATFLLLSLIPWEGIGKALATIIGVIAILGAAAVLISAATKNMAGDSEAAAIIGSFGKTLLMISAALVIAALIPQEALTKAQAAINGSVIVLGAMVALITFVSKSNVTSVIPTIVALSVFALAISAAFFILAKVPAENLQPVMESMIGVMIALGLIVAVTTKMNWAAALSSMAIILTMAGLMVVIGYTLNMVANVDAGVIAAFAGILLVVAVALGVLMAAATAFQPGALTLAGILLALALVFVGIGVAALLFAAGVSIIVSSLISLVGLDLTTTAANLILLAPALVALGLAALTLIPGALPLAAFVLALASIQNTATLMTTTLPLATAALLAFSAAANSSGQNVVDGVVGGIVDGMPTALKRIGGVFEGVFETINDTLGIQSPSTKGIESGLNIDSGVLGGVEQGMPDLQSGITELFGELDFGAGDAPEEGGADMAIGLFDGLKNTLGGLDIPKMLGDAFKMDAAVIDPNSDVAKEEISLISRIFSEMMPLEDIDAEIKSRGSYISEVTGHEISSISEYIQGSLSYYGATIGPDAWANLAGLDAAGVSALMGQDAALYLSNLQQTMGATALTAGQFAAAVIKAGTLTDIEMRDASGMTKLMAMPDIVRSSRSWQNAYKKATNAYTQLRTVNNRMKAAVDIKSTPISVGGGSGGGGYGGGGSGGGGGSSAPKSNTFGDTTLKSEFDAVFAEEKRYLEQQQTAFNKLYDEYNADGVLSDWEVNQLKYIKGIREGYIKRRQSLIQEVFSQERSLVDDAVERQTKDLEKAIRKGLDGIYTRDNIDVFLEALNIQSAIKLSNAASAGMLSSEDVETENIGNTVSKLQEEAYAKIKTIYNPSSGASFTVNGVTYRYDGSRWINQANNATISIVDLVNVTTSATIDAVYKAQNKTPIDSRDYAGQKQLDVDTQLSKLALEAIAKQSEFERNLTASKDVTINGKTYKWFAKRGDNPEGYYTSDGGGSVIPFADLKTIYANYLTPIYDVEENALISQNTKWQENFSKSIDVAKSKSDEAYDEIIKQWELAAKSAADKGEALSEAQKRAWETAADVAARNIDRQTEDAEYNAITRSISTAIDNLRNDADTALERLKEEMADDGEWTLAEISKYTDLYNRYYGVNGEIAKKERELAAAEYDAITRPFATGLENIQQDATVALQNLAEQIGEDSVWTIAEKEQYAALKNYWDSQIKLYADSSDSMRQQVKDFNDSFDLSTTMSTSLKYKSPASLTRSLTKTITRASEFATNLEKLKKAGVPNGILQELWGMGIDDGWKASKRFVASLDSEGNMSADLASAAKLYQNAEKISTNYGNIISESIYGALSDTDKLSKAGTDFATAFYTAFCDTLGIHSPATAFIDAGKDIGAGTQIGLDKNIPVLKPELDDSELNLAPSLAELNRQASLLLDMAFGTSAGLDMSFPSLDNGVERIHNRLVEIRDTLKGMSKYQGNTISVYESNTPQQTAEEIDRLLGRLVT